MHTAMTSSPPTQQPTKKHVTFRAKISKMGDKIHIIIPKSYHRDIEKQKLCNEYVDVEVSKDANE